MSLGADYNMSNIFLINLYHDRMVYLYQPLLWLHITTQVVYVADHSVKHHTMIKFVSYLSQVSCFLRLLRFPQRKK